MMDKKARNILFKTYWKNGWIDDRDRTTTKEDFEYAKSRGLMFDNISITHNECIHEILEIIEKISIEKVSQAFLSSLSNRRLDWRSSIASYSIAKQLTNHEYSKAVSGHGYNENGEINYTSYTCGICRELKHGIWGYEKYVNEDLNVLNFERIKWGGVRFGKILYTLFDLRMFCAEEISGPTSEDINILKNMLQTIESSQPNDYPGALEKRLSGCIKSSKNERKVLIEIMACIEILKPGSYDRPTTGRHDWRYAEFWRGEDKYNKDAVRKYFGKYL
ncbi:MAG: hypothetical protein LBP52_03715 [Burkholderiaceae bacterium]|jgi:hypothetical protein|nr:hypothetical protein [Burkholderiaceae bacterium]